MSAAWNVIGGSLRVGNTSRQGAGSDRLAEGRTQKPASGPPASHKCPLLRRWPWLSEATLEYNGHQNISYR